MEDALVLEVVSNVMSKPISVLILVVMEDALVPMHFVKFGSAFFLS